MSTLQALRARLNAANTKNTSTKDSQLFPFYDAEDSTTSTVRFLPDGNPKNDFFWVERQYIKLPFNGIVGQNLDKKVEIQVPCIEMYDPSLKCPVHQELRKWYKDDSLKDLAQSYWKKRNYLFQGFVRQTTIEEEALVNPIRRFNFTSQVFNPIKAFLLDEELQELPTSYEAGLDFLIKKSTKGKYADYSTSNWARRESALTKAELDAIDQHGLFNLSDFIPKRPNDNELQAIVEMFEASVDGQAYDPDRWSQFYRPYGLNAATTPENKVSVPVSRPVTVTPKVVTPVVVEESAPWNDAESAAEDGEQVEQPAAEVVTPTPATSGSRAQDVLAMIRSRQQKAV